MTGTLLERLYLLLAGQLTADEFGALATGPAVVDVEAADGVC